MRTMKFNSLPLSTLTSALLLAVYGGAWAQTPPVPDAGQVLRDLRQARPVPPQQTAPLQRIEESADLNQQGEAKVLVKSIAITGNQEIASAELQPLVAGLIGAERSLSQLNAAARRITAYYRSKGFAVARAYLPAQDITDGAVTISIIEGRISSHKINNQSLLSDERAQAYLGQVKDGDVIRSEQIDRGLLLLQDTPGVSSSRATLQPGASVGTSELLIEVNPAKPYSGSVVADNYGSRYTGEYRLAGTFNLASPLKIGDQITANLLTSGDNLSFARLAYQLPVGSDGLRLGAAYSDIHYKLGKEFEALQAHGTATSASVFAAYPFIRSQFKNLSGTVSYEDKNLKDYVDGTNTYTPKKVGVTTLGLSGSLQDALGGGGITGLDLSVAFGNLSINSSTALAIDNASAQSNGSYTRFSYGANRLQRFHRQHLPGALGERPDRQQEPGFVREVFAGRHQRRARLSARRGQRRRRLPRHGGTAPQRDPQRAGHGVLRRGQGHHQPQALRPAGIEQPQPGRRGRGRERQPGPGATALVPGLAHRRRFADVHPGVGSQAAYVVDAGFGRFLK
jgi:hemolysin activation/secretion protein